MKKKIRPFVWAVLAAVAMVSGPARAGVSWAIKKVAAGRHHTCALSTAGGVYCWGAGGRGQLGTGGRQPWAVPRAVVGLGASVRDLAAGGEHSCAVLEGGQVMCWGQGAEGQLGSSGSALVPKQVPGLGDAVSIVAGGKHSCALRQSGKVSCWGTGRYGQRGDGASGLGEDIGQHVATVTGLDEVTALAAGRDHSCALSRSGEVSCWGANEVGQLGLGRISLAEPWARRVGGLDLAATRIAANEENTCAILIGGRLRCWGDSWWGQLGTTDKIRFAQPIRIADAFEFGVADVGVGREHICALVTSPSHKKLWCLGDRKMRQLAEAQAPAVWFTPQVVSQWFQQRATKPVEAHGLPHDLRRVVAGGRHTCALTGGGQAWCWGHNFFGQLGNGTTHKMQPGPLVFR